MNRRHAVRKLVIASGGLISLPFWMTACRMSDKDTHLSSFSLLERDTLAGIADTIIPAGAEGVGALSVGVDKFLQKLIDDCYEKPAQDNVKWQLAVVDASARATYGKSFANCTGPQKKDMVLKGLASADKEEKDFFVSMKSETIRGFNTSQQVMEGYLNYKVAPGHYYGCVTIKT
jgi:hypothetical protein